MLTSSVDSVVHAEQARQKDPPSFASPPPQRSPQAPPRYPAQPLSQLYHTAWTIRTAHPPASKASRRWPMASCCFSPGTGLYRFDRVRFQLFEPPGAQPSHAFCQCLSTLCDARTAVSGSAIASVASASFNVCIYPGATESATVCPRGSVITIVEAFRRHRIGSEATGGLARFEGNSAGAGAVPTIELHRVCRDRDPRRPQATRSRSPPERASSCERRRDSLRARRTSH